MRVLMILSAAVLAACASSTAGSARRDAENLRVAGPQGGMLRVTSNAQANATTIVFPIGKVWHALPAAFESLGIPITEADEAQHSIGNGGLKVRRELGKVSLSRYIDCGTTQIGENAESYDVVLTVTSQLEEDSGSGLTTMRTSLEAMARPVAFSRDYSRCSSKGVLEKRLADAVKAQLQ